MEKGRQPPGENAVGGSFDIMTSYDKASADPVMCPGREGHGNAQHPAVSELAQPLALVPVFSPVGDVV